MKIENRLDLLFSYAFRPLFLLLVVQAIAMVLFWSLYWSGLLPFTWERNPISWHGHEMLNGFAGAAIGGFLLTAVANWTNRPAVSGWPLMLLCAVWIGGRLSVSSAVAAAVFDIGYWLLLLSITANEILRAGNRRNYKLLVVLGAMLLTDLGWHYAELHQMALQRQFLWGQLWLVLLLVTTIGGRVIPAFTGNWLRRQTAPAVPARKPAAFNYIDLMAILALLLFALCTLFPVPPTTALVVGLVAATLHAVRLVRWLGHLTLSDPLVWMMHLSYAWIPLGIALMALASAGLLSPSAGIHALTTGAIAGMIVSMSSRAALGHTNRALVAHPLLTSSIVLLNLTAVLRVGGSIFDLSMLIEFSALAWIAAFLCYGYVYVPVLLGPPAKP
jgi:uncharacterized protein involved in response to NO